MALIVTATCSACRSSYQLTVSSTPIWNGDLYCPFCGEAIDREDYEKNPLSQQ